MKDRDVLKTIHQLIINAILNTKINSNLSPYDSKEGFELGSSKTITLLNNFKIHTFASKYCPKEHLIFLNRRWILKQLS